MISQAFKLCLFLTVATIAAQALYVRSPQYYADLFSFTRHDVQGFEYTEQQLWFESQKVDHFKPQDTRVFPQRYWVSADYYQPNGPVFLYICGEYTCPGINQERLFPVQLAQEHNALFVVLEHRFYGFSQPFANLSTESLSYLTVEQALEDLAYFIGWFKVNSGYQLTPQQPWITIGGSYPGALSAWFRYKYPHLTVGAWASSAVVNAITDFPDFDNQIFLSTNKSGSECPTLIQNLTAYFETQLYNTPALVQKQFQARFGENATLLSREELLWFISDVFVESVQYGSRESLCEFLTNITDFSTLVNQAISYIVEKGDPRSYGSYFLKNPTFSPATMDLGRQWIYQVCSQFGWLQTPSQTRSNAMRSQKVNLAFYKKFCQDVFGIPLWPDTDAINNELGGLDLQATRLIMTNGGEDPWQWASKTTSSGDIESILIDCDDCAHCVDLYTPKDSDAQTLKDAREQISSKIAEFLST